MDTDKIVEHWGKSSDDDYAAMLILYNARSYGWALFMGHIAIEKLLKAYYVKQHGTHAPFTHNLYRLAELGGLEVDEQRAEWLFRITTFNINARYDDYKKEFYTLCTADFTKEWIEKTETLRLWIKNML
jgi:HEPN domain-containing protein